MHNPLAGYQNLPGLMLMIDAALSHFHLLKFILFHLCNECKDTD